MNPFCQELFRENRILYSDSVSKQKIEEILLNQTWEYDVPGYISKDDLISIINSNQIIHKGDKLNGKMPMDADNYYVQAGDMRSIEEFIKLFK